MSHKTARQNLTRINNSSFTDYAACISLLATRLFTLLNYFISEYFLNFLTSDISNNIGLDLLSSAFLDAVFISVISSRDQNYIPDSIIEIATFVTVKEVGN